MVRTSYTVVALLAALQACDPPAPPRPEPDFVWDRAWAIHPTPIGYWEAGALLHSNVLWVPATRSPGTLMECEMNCPEQGRCERLSLIQLGCIMTCSSDRDCPLGTVCRCDDQWECSAPRYGCPPMYGRNVCETRW